jgi:hypothetical protein
VAHKIGIIDTLRSSRRVDDAIVHLKEGSLEARAERIQEAMTSPDWTPGPGELIATYPHHALCSKDGVIMQVKVEEVDGEIKLGKVEVHELPTPSYDIGEEVMATAMAAVDHILGEEFEEATPMIASIANALSTTGDLQRRITSEVAKRSVNRKAWWHSVVSEHMKKDIHVLAINPDDLAESIDRLKTTLVGAAKQAAQAIIKLGEDTGTDPITDVAKDIAADLKYAIQALNTTDPENVDEARGIVEGVHQVAGYLLLGAEFLKSLVENTESTDGENE